MTDPIYRRLLCALVAVCALAAGRPARATDFNPCPLDMECRIMPLGDSITYGTGSGFGPTQNGGYRVRLFQMARAAQRTITFVGSQKSGPTTVDGVQFPTSH
jgi:hypothetical protein